MLASVILILSNKINTSLFIKFIYQKIFFKVNQVHFHGVEVYYSYFFKFKKFLNACNKIITYLDGDMPTRTCPKKCKDGYSKNFEDDK